MKVLYDIDWLTEDYRIVRGFLGRTKVQRWMACPNTSMRRWVNVPYYDCHTFLRGIKR